MRRILVLAMVATVPCLLFLNVWQGFRYERLQKRVESMEAMQRDLYDRNKKLIAGIAVYSSPERVELAAKRDLGLQKLSPSDILTIEIPYAGDSGGER